MVVRSYMSPSGSVAVCSPQNVPKGFVPKEDS